MNEITYKDYPGTAVLHDIHVIGYLTACMKAGVESVRTCVNSDDSKKVHGYDLIPVDIEAPMQEQRYPYIHVIYDNKGFEPESLSDWSKVVYRDKDNVAHEDILSRYKFDGRYSINIYATSILERETISDCLIGAIGIDETFRKTLVSNEYINIAPNMHTLASNVSNESWGTPWDADVMTCFRQFTFDVVGEFYYRLSDIPAFLEKIVIEAHRENPELNNQPEA